MQAKTFHIKQILTSILLIVCLLSPLATKLLHCCHEHEHQETTCKNHEGVHFHKTHQDCSACKAVFKFNTTVPEIASYKAEIKHEFNPVFSFVKSFASANKPSFNLRGPPSC